MLITLEVADHYPDILMDKYISGVFEYNCLNKGAYQVSRIK